MEYSLEDLKSIAGCDIKQTQIDNFNTSPLVDTPLDKFNNKLDDTDKGLEGLANRLNSLLGSEFTSTIKIDRL